MLDINTPITLQRCIDYQLAWNEYMITRAGYVIPNQETF